LQEIVDECPGDVMIFADSGAFSAHTQGSPVNINDYAQWLNTWRHLITVYVNLDVIRDPAATAANQRILERKGLAPVPVFHTGVPWRVFDDLCANYPYVALGGMVGTSTNQAVRWAGTCFKRAEGTGTVFHGFGQTRREVIESLPWYSVDSTTWGDGQRYGQVAVWDNNRLLYVAVGDPASVYRYARQLRAAGVPPDLIADRSKYHRRYAIRAASFAWRRYEAWLRARHGPIHQMSTVEGTP
jgi:hypothetical protein